MKAAQYMLGALTMVMIAAGATLIIFEENVAGWTCLGVGFFGFLLIAGMVGADSRTSPPPGP